MLIITILKYISRVIAITVGVLVLPGVDAKSFWVILLFALLLGIVNALLRPILLLISLPINMLTLGLFYLVINAIIIMVTDYFIKGFTIVNIWWAIAFGIVIMLVEFLLKLIFSEEE